MKKRDWFLLASATLVFFLIGGAYSIMFKNDFWATLEKKFKDGETSVYLKEITDFNWDLVCVVPPYALDLGENRDQRIKEYIQGDISRLKNKIPILNQDNAYIFVFIKNDVAVNVEKKGRSFYLQTSYTSNCISSDKAIFRRKGEYVWISDHDKGIE